MSRRRRWLGGAIAGLAAVSLAACSSAASSGSAGNAAATSGSTVPAAGSPVRGGSLSYAVDQAEDTLNPAVSPEDVTGLIDRNIFDSLVVQTGANTFGPWLATRWTISPDGKTYTFFLKQGVRFQDGTPFNAAAVKASLDYAVNPATKSEYASALIAAYKSSKAISDYTIQVSLSAPFAPFLQALSTAYLGIQSPAELAKPASQYVPVGTGPYKYVAWNKNLNVILARVPAYTSAPSNATHTGPAYLDKLTFDFVSADATRYGALTSGQVQAIADVPPIDVKPLEATSGFYIQRDPSPGDNYNLYLNTKFGSFADPNVRKAFVESVNVPALVKSVYFGVYTPATNPIGPTTAFFDATATTPAYNVAAAEKLLDQAGWTQKDSAGYRVKNGHELTVMWPYAASNIREERDVLADGIVAQAKAAGIHVERPVLDLTQYIASLQSGNYAIADFSFVRGSADILRYSYAEPTSVGGGDVSQVSNTQLSGWLNGATQTTNQAVQRQDYSKAEHYVLDNADVLPMYIDEYRMGASGKLRGITFDAQAFPLFYSAYLVSS